MKKFIVLLVFILLSGTVYADDTAIKVKVDGNYLEFDQPPIIHDGRTLVPMRAIFEALGAVLVWDNDTRIATATKGEIIVRVDMSKSEGEVMVNGLYVWSDVPPKIVSDRILVPVRVISQSFENIVDWDGTTRTVTVTSYDQDSLMINKSLSGYWINSDYFSAVSDERSVVDLPNYTLINFYKNDISTMTFHKSSDFVPLTKAKKITKDIYIIQPKSPEGDQLFPHNCNFIIDNSSDKPTLSMNDTEMLHFGTMNELEDHVTKLIFKNKFTDESGNLIQFDRVWLDTIDVPGEDCVDITDKILSDKESLIFKFTETGVDLYELLETEFGIYERGELRFSLTEEIEGTE